jgi:hypothetical protein
MAQAALGAQAGLAPDDRAQQLVGAERALHQHLGATLTDQRNRLLGSGVTVLRVDDLEG